MSDEVHRFYKPRGVRIACQITSIFSAALAILVVYIILASGQKVSVGWVGSGVGYEVPDWIVHIGLLLLASPMFFTVYLLWQTATKPFVQIYPDKLVVGNVFAFDVRRPAEPLEVINPPGFGWAVRSVSGKPWAEVRVGVRREWTRVVQIGGLAGIEGEQLGQALAHWVGVDQQS